jgi:8-oxo-dGTP pyrophosphatase MutT (NUDIX family)
MQPTSERSRDAASLRSFEELHAEHDTACARALLATWAAPDAEQCAARDRIVAWIERYPADAHRRERREGHLTASALVVDHSRGAALLTHHRQLGRWLQLGGHCDGDANLARCALREATEESGIEGLRIDPRPLDLDVHAIPARPGEPEHWHLDTRFLVLAPAGAIEALSDESLALRWFRPADLAGIPTDESVRRLFRRVFPEAREGPRDRAGMPPARPV